MSHIHPRARTTPLIRAEIQASNLGVVELAERYHISRATVAKWKNRPDVQDRSHRPHQLSTTLSPAQEVIVAEIRRLTLIPLDDLLVVVRQFIHPDVSRSGLGRCLVRHGVSNLRALVAAAQTDAGEAAEPTKSFKDYQPGFVHMDIKYLPQMPDEDKRRYLFVAIDRATRWVFLKVYDDQTDASSVDFLQRLEEAAPMKITKLLTDNGSQFTDRFTCKDKVPSGEHAFDRACENLEIEHRLCPPRHPQTNGMVERFNGRISELVKQTRFKSGAELEATLMAYGDAYNHRIPQRALDHRTPMQTVLRWREKAPALFKRMDNDQAGLDITQIHADYFRVVAEADALHPPVTALSSRRGRAKQSTATNLLRRLRDHADSVLRFTHDLSVPFTINLAERAIRIPKVKQKISGCFRTTDGAQHFATIRSTLDALRKQGHS